MKTKIATALSLVGVLGAGSAAAMVNTQILDSGPADADTAAILTPAPQQASTTAATTSSSTTAATTTTPSTTIAPVVVTPAPAPAVSPFLTSYDLGASGIVTVDVVGGVTTLVTATPNPGWTVASSETDPAENTVEVDLTDGTTVVELEVRFDGTRLVPEVSSSLIGGPAGTAAAPTGDTVTRNTVDDDDDDHGGDDDGEDDDDHGGDDDDHDDD